MLKKIKILGLSMGIVLCAGSFSVCRALKNDDNNSNDDIAYSQQYQLINEVQEFNQEGQRNNRLFISLMVQAILLDEQRHGAHPNSVSLVNLINVAARRNATINVNSNEFNSAERQLLNRFNAFIRTAIAHRQRGEILQRRLAEIRNRNHNAHF